MAKTWSQKVAAAFAFILLGALAWELMGEPGLLGKAQRATELTYDLGDVRKAGGWDYLFMAAYGGLLIFLLSLIREPEADPATGKRSIHSGAIAGMLLAAAAVLADAVENVFLLLAFWGENGNAKWLNEMRAAGLFKWGLLVAAVLTLLTLALHRSWRAPLKPYPSTTTPPGRERDWAPPRKCTCCVKPTERRIGICLSGGGIRSAAFSLGALQTLREAGKVDKAKYLAAVSGGGYLAAGWALSNAEAPANADPKPWDPRSPEERWFRNHASYLIPDTKGGLAGIFRLLAGLAVNVVLVVVLLSAAARPIGWAMHGTFTEFQGHDKPLIPRDATVDMKVVGFVPLDGVDKGDDEGRVARYLVDLDPGPDKDDGCFFNPATKDRPNTCFTVRELEDKRALIEVQHSRISIVRQPKVAFDAPTDRPKLAPKVALDPKLEVVDGGLIAEKDAATPLPKHFKVETMPLVKVTSGVAALAHPGRERWMWELVAGLAAGALAASLAVTILRPCGRKGQVMRALARSLGGTAAVAVLLFIALPWLVVWLPRTLAGAFENKGSIAGSSVLDYVVPGGGLLALVATAARQYFNSATAPSDGKKGGGVFKSVKDALTGKKKELKWYELTPTKLFAAVASFAALVVVFVNALQFAVVNGPKGEVMGFVGLADELPSWAFVPDATELAVIVLGLAVFALAADAHTWSLFPFYKERLSSAFLVKRTGGDVAELPYEDLVPFTRLKDKPGPQLVACCAVNLSDYGLVPPGRRAASFTFSSTEIGGPIVGYMKPEDFTHLPESRQRDVTVASAMAISGAAFSPAMGKTNLGPLGPLLALANLRLGVWLPHPRRARDRDKADTEWSWQRLRRPHWVWFLRELTNKYKFNRRYLYVSDGGHWDNLGLVELLRRGCNEIYCISGAGDGAESFGTIGEAIALAREELGVEIDLDASALRAATKAADPVAKRELRRAGSKEKAAVYAAAGAVEGKITFKEFPDAAPGTVYYRHADG